MVRLADPKPKKEPKVEVTGRCLKEVKSENLYADFEVMVTGLDEEDGKDEDPGAA